MRALLLVSFLLFFSDGFSQKTIFVLDSLSKIPIQGVLMSSEKTNIGFSNLQGKLVVSDTCLYIKLSCTGYIAKIFLKKYLKDTVLLQEEIQKIEEITVKSIIDYKKIGFYKTGKSSQHLFFIHHKYEYALLINQPYKNSFLTMIDIPASINEHLDKRGFLKILFVKNTTKNAPGNVLLGFPIYIRMESLQKKNIRYKLETPFELPDEDFFMVISRVIEDEMFFLHKNIVSVNPGFHVAPPNTKALSYFRDKLNKEWTLNTNNPAIFGISLWITAN